MYEPQHAPMKREIARDLDEYGVVIVPVFAEDQKRADWSNGVWKAMDDFPEYIVKGQTAQRVLGGFGALGNPSSFHHPVVQELRATVKRHVTGPLFAEYAVLRNWDCVNYEMLYDRLCVRYRTFGSIAREAWHRDIYDGLAYDMRDLPCTLPGDNRDLIFGGWVNLSDENQHFVCQLGSHKSTSDAATQYAAGGFVSADAISKIQAKDALNRQAGQSIGHVYCDAKGHVVVPPGYLVLFSQSILHAVAGGAGPKNPSLRLFMGHRLTTESAPLFDSLESIVVKNSVPRLPSGQVAPMYSSNHYSMFSTFPRYREWGQTTFKPVCLFNRVTPAGVQYATPGSSNGLNSWVNRKRTMPSLSEMGFLTYMYTQNTFSVMTPEPLEAFGDIGNDIGAVFELI